MVAPGCWNQRSVPFIDQIMMVHATEKKQVHLMQFRWLADVIRAGIGKIALKAVDDSSDSWLLPLGIVGDCHIVVYPFYETFHPEIDGVHLHPRPAVQDFRSLFIWMWDTKAWDAIEIEWLSPFHLHDWVNFVGFSVEELSESGIVAQQNGDKRNIVSLAAMSCFWGAKETLVGRVLDHFGIAHPEKASRFQYCKIAAHGLAGVAEASVLMSNVLRDGLVGLSAEIDPIMEEFLELDGACSWKPPQKSYYFVGMLIESEY